MRKDNYEKAIAALIAAPNVREAAKLAGIGESTLHDYLRDREFRAMYDQTRKEFLSLATARLQGNLTAAVSAMVEIVQDKDAAPQVRLNAADGIIRNCLRLTEQLDIVQRLDAVERRLDEKE